MFGRSNGSVIKIAFILKFTLDDNISIPLLLGEILFYDDQHFLPYKFFK